MKTIRELVTELSNLQNVEDKTLPLLRSFLYAEHYAFRLCKDNKIENKFEYVCKKCGNITGTRALSLSEMISKLIDKEIVDENLYEIFALLNKLRHKLIHNISPDTEQIISWIGKFEPPTNDAVKKLISKADVWLCFYLSLIPAIAYLYSKIDGTIIQLETIEYNIPSKNWIFHFK